ncbi:dehydrogenase [Niveispirillum lacus]|uniref:Dehydrogenase n=1 Tax=Niveispirillum lacus TaxID=1981099 RepID=A0A255YYM9_9PROT|nr:SDR family oxidoreductase [Niveispirillum lacus]OYQ34302.1 dehydrogenase [Niveispirillum lacus]
MARLDGKVALVTGGTAGIGAAAVRRLSADGAKVVFTGSNAAAAEAVSQETGAHFQAHDVTDEAAWPALMQTIAERFGRLDIAFANAGIEVGDGSIETIGLAAWNRIMAVNVTGTMLTCQHAIAAMKANPGGSGGSIIINSSINGLVGLPANIAYTTSKGAVRLLAKSVAVHCARTKTNIRCNSIHPGIIDTPIIRRAVADTTDPEASLAYLGNISPLGRLGQVEEVAALVSFLASEDSSLINGAELVADGGTTAGLVGV